MLRVVVDTNLFISALLPGSKTTALLKLLQQRRFTLASSEEALLELLMVLLREKFRRYFTQQAAIEALDLIRDRAELFQPTAALRLCRDPKDDFLLNLAVAAVADVIVSGDSDLLDDSQLRQILLTEYNIRVLSAAEFIAILEAEA